MAKIRLTQSVLGTLTCGEGQQKAVFYDEECRGLLLEVRPSGGKTFYVRYSDERGRQRQYKLGDGDIVPLAKARAAAKRVLADVMLGGDPQEKRQERRQAPRFEAFVRERYLPHVQTYKRSWETDDTILRLHVLPALGRLAMDEVTTDDVARILSGLQKEGYAVGTVNRVLVLIRYIFNLARKWEVPGVSRNPTAPLSPGRATQRERFLSREEAGRLLDAIRRDENQKNATAILLMLLTGARRSEILFAEWKHVDVERRVLLVPRAKSGKPRQIALNAAALATLERMAAEREGPYLFASAKTGRPPKGIGFNWQRIRTRAGLPDLRLHDLRHSFASFLVNSGVSLYVVQTLLGHAQIRTTQRYSHLTDDTLKEAVDVVSRLVSPRLKAPTPAIPPRVERRVARRAAGGA